MTIRFAFVLAREFTLSPLAMFVDTLRLAGDEGDRSRRVLFDWQVVGDRGLPVRSSSGFELMPTAQLGDPRNYDHVVLVGGLLGTARTMGAEKERFLLEAAARNIPITALCTASFHLAKLGLDISRRQLERLFSAELGLGPKQALLKMRVELAKGLLAGTNLTKAEIASRCGFGSPQHFAKVFSRETGRPPSVARRMH